MPPRPTARCCRATLAPHHAPIEAVWVTDDVLSRAFQQYVQATAPRKRSVSSAPGPLYHRQRLGRRRMTDLNSFQSTGSIPVWALPNAPDMTKWQWQPPKPPSFWPQLPQVQNAVETDSGPLLAEPEAEMQPLVAPEPPEKLALGETAAVREEIVLQTLYETSRPLGLKLQALFNEIFPTARDFTQKFRSFAKLLSKEISDGRLRGPQIFEVYGLGRRAFVRAKRTMPQVTGSSLLPLLSSVIEGIKATENRNPGFLRSSPHHWAILIKHLARHSADVKTARLFALLMESMPRICRFKTRGAILNVLSAYFRVWQGSSINGTTTENVEIETTQAFHLAAIWAGRADLYQNNVRSELALKRLKYARTYLEVARKCHERAQRFSFKAAHLLSDDKQIIGYLAEGLRTHHPRVHRSLFVIATRLTGTRVGKWTRLRFNWLHILARLPNIRQSQFKSLLQLFPKRGPGALSHTEFGDLLLLHWESNGMLTDLRSIRKIWKKLRGEEDSTALAALAFAINAKTPPEQSTAILWSFWDFIHLQVGVKTITKQMLSLSNSQNLSVAFLKRLAWTSGDYRTALMLHDILVKQAGKDTNAWGPAFWDKYVTQNMKRPRYCLVNPVVLVEKLLGSARPAESVCQEIEPQDSSGKSELKHRQLRRIRESISIISISPSLTERQRFRHTAAFTKYLAKVQGFLTARDMASLTDVITEVLKRGQGGSTQRLRWYLGMVLEQLGEEACTQVGMILKRRREWNGRQLASRMTPEQPMLKPHTSSDLHRQHYEGPHQGRTWPLWRYHLPKNRQRVKLCRARRKTNIHISRRRVHDERPHETRNCQGQGETEAPPPSNGDAFDALCEGSHRQEIDPRAFF